MAIDRVAIFVDAGYLEKVLVKDFNRIPIDFGKFAIEIAAGKDLLRTYYYNCPPYQSNPPTVDEARRTASADNFYAALRRLPRFEIRLGKLVKRACSNCGNLRFQQKRADLLLAVDLVNVSAKQQISKAILIAGDSDFLPAITVAKDSGVLVHLFHGGPSNPPHHDLFAACDERTLISQALIDKIKLALT